MRPELFVRSLVGGRLASHIVPPSLDVYQAAIMSDVCDGICRSFALGVALLGAAFFLRRHDDRWCRGALRSFEDTCYGNHDTALRLFYVANFRRVCFFIEKTPEQLARLFRVCRNIRLARLGRGLSHGAPLIADESFEQDNLCRRACNRLVLPS